jgi:hypothetical protein
VRGNTNGISPQRGEKMLVMTATFEKNIVDKIRKLSEIQKLELLSYIESLNEKFKRFEGPKGLNRALRAVEDTWGTMNLSEKIEYIAEDKELEYEI